MDRYITGKRPHFRPVRRQSNFYHVMILLGMILAGVWFLLAIQRGAVRKPFLPTPTPTRTANSYIQEAQAYFEAGKLYDPDPPQPTPPHPDAIDTYQRALALDEGNARIWGELARIQAYSSSMLRNDMERKTRLDEALTSADRAVALAPDDSTVHAVRAFVLDWYASNSLVSPEKAQDKLNEANNEALRAYELDHNNALALAYYAEILIDQQKFQQARKYAEQAVQQGPDLMDTHRAYGYVLETWGEYNSAIIQYLQAAKITPNLTFLYVIIGRLYREGIHNPDRAIEYFDEAAGIDGQLGVENPIPYVEIARTYTQMGQFFAAANNAKKALEIDKYNANTYGQLGAIFIQARNYEGAKPLLQCAVVGCTPEQNEMGQVAVDRIPMTNLTVAYYYVQYGTVLAFLSKPNDNYCPEARQVLQEVRQQYPKDKTLMQIVEDSEGICTRLEQGILPGTPSSPGTGEPPATAPPITPSPP